MLISMGLIKYIILNELYAESIECIEYHRVEKSEAVSAMAPDYKHLYGIYDLNKNQACNKH